MSAAEVPCAREGCGKTFPAVVLPGSPKKYCSKNCGILASSVRRRGQRSSRFNTCPTCGQQFHPPVQNTLQVFCSRACGGRKGAVVVAAAAVAAEPSVATDEEVAAPPPERDRIGPYLITRLPDGRLVPERLGTNAYFTTENDK